ncbi:MAG TPA: hypothetical protein VGE93_14160 [Bryobacteraceae bacterium]|nr:hypothetical protein [Acidobacteriaceae bacterium]
MTENIPAPKNTLDAAPAGSISTPSLPDGLAMIQSLYDSLTKFSYEGIEVPSYLDGIKTCCHEISLMMATDPPATAPGFSTIQGICGVNLLLASSEDVRGQIQTILSVCIATLNPSASSPKQGFTAIQDMCNSLLPESNGSIYGQLQAIQGICESVLPILSS